MKDVFRPYFISEIAEWFESAFGFQDALKYISTNLILFLWRTPKLILFS
jgi:hypothetical protein